MTTVFHQTQPDPDPFQGDVIEHLQAVLDGLDDFEGIELDDIADDWTRDAVAAHRRESGVCCECGGDLKHCLGELRTYDHPGFEPLTYCVDCGEVAA